MKNSDMILCDGNYGLGAYGMDPVHNREPERSRLVVYLFQHSELCKAKDHLDILVVKIFNSVPLNLT